MSVNEALISKITIYGGFPLFICGTLGNLLNILLIWRTRRNPCAFLFLVSSFVNCIALFYGLFTRILSVGFYLDWSSTNRAWCKTRTAFSQASFLISLTCTCLASIDRFLISCRQNKYRKLSRLSIAMYAVTITIIFWLSLAIPFFLNVELLKDIRTGLVTCSLVPGGIFPHYIRYFSFPVYYGVLPTTVLTITGVLTYINTSKLQIVRQRQALQRRLTVMMLTQIPIILLATVPYVIFTEYSMFTTTMMKSAKQVEIELVLTNVFSITSYTPFACPFFVFLISSKSFREEAKLLLLFCKTNSLKANQVQPNSQFTTRNVQSLLTKTHQMPLNSIAFSMYKIQNCPLRKNI